MGGKRARHDSDWREGLVGVERKRANKKATKGSRRMGKRCRRSVEEWQKSSSVAVYNTFKQTLQRLTCLQAALWNYWCSGIPLEMLFSGNLSAKWNSDYTQGSKWITDLSHDPDWPLYSFRAFSRASPSLLCEKSNDCLKVHEKQQHNNI